MNTRELYYGDNLNVLHKYFRDETIDVCYIDPPFNSKRNYNQIYNNIGKEDRAQAQAFVDTWTWDSIAIEGYDAICTNHYGSLTRQAVELIQGLKKVLGEGSLLAYLVSMTLRIAEIWRVLKPTGSFYLHCDPTASHYLKIVLDAIFCGHGGDFQNEIVWCYTSGGKSTKRFAKKHDIVFFYTKHEEYPFYVDAVRVPYSEKTLANYKPGLKGSTYTSDITLNKLGKVPEDYWHIAIASKSTKEYLKYPTQKPEALLERIINASSQKNDIILDAYCGCGTSISVAERLGRQWRGIDITYQSISVILKRIEETFGKDILQNIVLNGVPQDIASARALALKKDDRVRKEFEKWAVLTYTDNRAVIHEKKGGDKGIDGVTFVQETADEYKQIIISVKSGKLQPSMIRDLRGTVEREQAAMGILLTLEEPTKGCIQEAKTAGIYQPPLMAGQAFDKLQIVTVEQILSGARLALPMTHEVLKKAKSKAKTEQGDFF